MTNSQLVIRSAEERDLPAILDIYNYAILHTTSVYDYKPHTLEMRKKWFEEKKAASHPVFVAELDGKVVGFIAYGYFRAWTAYRYTVEHSVHVHYNYRRQGIAKQLLSKIIDFAKQHEVHAFIAGIDATNTSSINLHEQFNFVEVGHFKQVGFKFNNWLDLKFYELLLNSSFQPNENP